LIRSSYPYITFHFQRTDQDAENHENVICIYSRRSEPKFNQDTGSNGLDAWNREHIYAKSHGDFGTSAGAGTDIHAIRAADKSVNTERSSKDFAEGGTQLTSEEPRDDCPLCMETNSSFEPPDEVKGDIARMIFYMVIRYNGDVGSNGVLLNVVSGIDTPYGSSTANNGIIGDLDALKRWHSEDPVSDEEKHRNNIIFDIQGNPNPFIDNPQFVDILFSEIGGT
jgi:serine protease